MLLKNLPIRTFVVEMTTEPGSPPDTRQISISCQSAHDLIKRYPDDKFSLQDNSIYYYIEDDLWEQPLFADDNDFKVIQEEPSPSKILLFPKSAYRHRELEAIARVGGYKTTLGNWIFDIDFALTRLDNAKSGNTLTGVSAFIPTIIADLKGWKLGGWSHVIFTDTDAETLLERRKKLNLDDDPARAMLERVIEVMETRHVDYCLGSVYARVSAEVVKDAVMPGENIILHDEQGHPVIRMSHIEYVQYNALGDRVQLMIAWELMKDFHKHFYNIKQILVNN